MSRSPRRVAGRPDTTLFFIRAVFKGRNSQSPAAAFRASRTGLKPSTRNPNSKGANKMLKQFFRDETGLELSEYAVAAALVALAVITAFTNLGTAIGNKIGALVSDIDSSVGK
jgi:pilus assembly protein Flp/PilA